MVGCKHLKPHPKLSKDLEEDDKKIYDTCKEYLVKLRDNLVSMEDKVEPSKAADTPTKGEIKVEDLEPSYSGPCRMCEDKSGKKYELLEGQKYTLFINFKGVYCSDLHGQKFTGISPYAHPKNCVEYKYYRDKERKKG